MHTQSNPEFFNNTNAADKICQEHLVEANIVNDELDETELEIICGGFTGSNSKSKSPNGLSL